LLYWIFLLEIDCLTFTQLQQDDIDKAAGVLTSGGLVALPTETVYGLGADARQDDAVRKIFTVKGRPNFNPLIVHVPGLDLAQEIGEFDELSNQLAEKFWPGPLTIVVPLKKSAGISEAVTAGLSTIALRVPDHKLSQELLARSGVALAAPSANSSGRLSPTSAEHVRQDLGPKVDFILDGGETKRGLESTIVKAELDYETGLPILVLLRLGPVTVDELEAVLGVRVVCPEVAIDETQIKEKNGDSSSSFPIAPGALLRHYAPKTSVRLEATEVLAGEGLLGFGAEDKGLVSELPFYNLSETGDLEEAAARLFAGLHWLDNQDVSGIAVRPIPFEGVGLAINDRLRRAANSS
jgi:L-threonylcarbamoyladenylate synthase